MPPGWPGRPARCSTTRPARRSCRSRPSTPFAPTTGASWPADNGGPGAGAGAAANGGPAAAGGPLADSGPKDSALHRELAESDLTRALRAAFSQPQFRESLAEVDGAGELVSEVEAAAHQV